MSKLGKPYVRCEKRDGELLLTVMRGVPGGHALGARGKCAAGDSTALKLEVIRLVEAARAGRPTWGKQADGHS